MASSCQTSSENKNSSDYQSDFVDVLNIKAVPESPDNLDAFGFSDMGAWHAYSLPNPDSTRYLGGFCGPLLMKLNGQWMSKSLCRLTITDEEGEIISYNPEKTKMSYLPGKLLQELQAGDFKIKLALIFTDQRTALVTTEIKNTSDKQKQVKLSWQGNVWLKNLSVKQGGSVVRISLPDSSFVSTSFAFNPSRVEYKNNRITIDGSEVTLEAGAKYQTSYCQSYFFNEKETAEHVKSTANYLQEPELYFRKNTKRWNGYLKAVLTKSVSNEKQRLAVKCVETLLSNWRSPAGALKHNGVFPSAAYQEFYAFWAWDTWKHAAALSLFDPELAKESIRSMFDFQNEAGMIADCVFFDSANDNWRDTKPPLAAWAVWKIWKSTADTTFIREMYPKLVKYHNWWYTNRDNNKNGLCEYGSTDGTLIAAKWESGMDNAVRFDRSQIRKDNEKAWSLNQESVDLNTYLQLEDDRLSRLALIIGNKKDAEVFTKEAAVLAQKIRESFWSKKQHYFLDLNTDDNSLIGTFGPEGWIPLWAGIATKEQAAGVVKVIIDSTGFNTRVPFPSLDASDSKFDPQNGYWRGPVWIDQAYFGIEALKRYGYTKEAEALKQELLTNAEGLLSDKPLRENYNPLTGQGLNANHFSWTAAHLLLLLNSVD